MSRFASNADEALECFFHFITFAGKREKDALIKGLVAAHPFFDPEKNPIGRSVAVAIDLDSNDRDRKEKMFFSVFQLLDKREYYDIMKDAIIQIPQTLKADFMKFLFEYPDVRATPVPIKAHPPPVNRSY
jgi:hypothetical protein